MTNYSQSVFSQGQPGGTPPVPTLPTPEMVMLEGMIDAKNLGEYTLSYAPGQLMVGVPGSPEIGGSYAVGSLPFGEWVVLADRRGFLLPMAVQRARADAYYVRVDPAPLQGLRALPSMAGY
jgi:hypothetical protein